MSVSIEFAEEPLSPGWPGSSTDADPTVDVSGDAPSPPPGGVATPGETAGLSTGAPLPEGRYFVDYLWFETVFDGPFILGSPDADVIGSEPTGGRFKSLEGPDQLSGGTGHDVLVGGRGRDVIEGGANGDALYGGRDDDHLVGGRGDDILSGGAGDDVLQGGAGADLLFGGAGNDVMSGGNGRDIFFVGRAGEDVVLDFDAAKDALNLEALGIDGIDELREFASERGGDLAIDFGDGDSLVLKGVSLADLDGADLFFG